MKISRTQDYLSITATAEEYVDITRRLGRDVQARCHAVLDPREERIIVRFGSGRVLSRMKDNWVVNFDVETARAKRLVEFGATPTTYRFIDKGTLEIKIPDVKSPLRQRRNVSKVVAAQHEFQARRLREIDLEKIKTADHTPYVSEEDFVKIKDVYNRAIDRGLVPAFDARGHILSFERKL